MGLTTLTEQGRVAAEQAALVVRARNGAADGAMHGRGFEALEGVIRDKGVDHQRGMLAAAASARPGAQRGGPAPAAAPRAGAGPSPRPSTREPSRPSSGT